MSASVSDTSLHALLIGSLIASILLSFGSMGMIARKHMNLTYQKAAGINGTHKIQGWIDLRIYCTFLLAGVTFSVFSILLLADTPMIWRQWVNRILFVGFPFMGFVILCINMLDENKQLFLEMEQDQENKEKEKILNVVAEQKRLSTLQAASDSWREMADEAVANLALAADQKKLDQGEIPISLPAVVPEHSSPVTVEQQLTADIATLRAKLVKATSELGLPPREITKEDGL